MTALLRLDEVGLATVQDGGRWGWAHVGVPAAGAQHRARCLAATGLIRGRLDDGAPAVEVLDGRLTATAQQRVAVCVVGPSTVEVDGLPAALGSVLAVEAGSTIRIAPAGSGPVYLAVGGWTPPSILGSCSTDTFSGIGPSPLRRGDALDGEPKGLDRVGAFHRECRALATARGVLRVVDPDPRLVDEGWRVLSTARSGTRLGGGSVVGEGLATSAPLVTGAIQATPSGELIVIGRDGGVSGGYPVVGVVATCDMDAVSTAAVGALVRFTPISASGAADLHRDSMRELAASLVPPSALASH